MDLNDLYHRHQVSLFLAEHGASAEARRAHKDRADTYALLIAGARVSARAA